ncbi:hypothetical protein NPIL_371571, partial [Nephila pilipes]
PSQDSVVRRVPRPKRADHDRIDKSRLSLPTQMFNDRKNQVRDKGGRDPWELLVDCDRANCRGDGPDNPVLDGVVPLTPGDAVWLAMI